MVAVAVEDDGLSGEIGGLVGGRALGEEVAEYIGLAAEGGGAGVLGEEVRSSSRKTLAQEGSRKTMGIPASISGRRASQVCWR